MDSGTRVSAPTCGMRRASRCSVSVGAVWQPDARRGRNGAGLRGSVDPVAHPAEKMVPTQGFVQQQLEDPLFILGPCKLQDIEYQALTAVTGGVQQAETDVQPLRQQQPWPAILPECGQLEIAGIAGSRGAAGYDRKIRIDQAGLPTVASSAGYDEPLSASIAVMMWHPSGQRASQDHSGPAGHMLLGDAGVDQALPQT